jgi:hypothetical protein
MSFGKFAPIATPRPSHSFVIFGKRFQDGNRAATARRIEVDGSAAAAGR